jgi:hypothetical protein
MEMRGQLHALTDLTPGKKPGATECKVGWATKPVWSFWRREKPLDVAGIRTPDRSFRSLVTIPTTSPA